MFWLCLFISVALADMVPTISILNVSAAAINDGSAGIPYPAREGLPQFDPPNFVCYKFDKFCDRILQEIGCATEDPANYARTGCPGNVTDNRLHEWVGECTCFYPVYYDMGGSRIAQQLIANRLSNEVEWMMEPYKTGPPFDLKVSYTNICALTLDRLGCPDEHQRILAVPDAKVLDVDGITNVNFQCSCGLFEEPSKQVLRLIMDDWNEYYLKSSPVFATPVYLNIPLSIAMTLIVGKICAAAAVNMKMPAIVGFLVGGIILQNVVHPVYLKGTGYPLPAPGGELKSFGLLIVLIRAGLSIKFDEISENKLATGLLCAGPYIFEFIGWISIGRIYYDWPIANLGLFASVMAPLGPSVVISSLMLLIGKTHRDHGYVTKQALISTPIEAVLAIILFSIFSSIVQVDGNPLLPWVKVLPVWATIVLVPVNLLFSIVLGVIVGRIVSAYIDWRTKSTQENDFVWVRVNKNYQLGSSTADLIFALLVCCYTINALCTPRYIQQSSSVLVIFTAAITVSQLTKNVKVLYSIADGLKGIWTFSECFLFTLTGCMLKFDPSNGPMQSQRGMSSTDVGILLEMIFIGLLFRTVCNFIVCNILAKFETRPHRRTWEWTWKSWVVWSVYQIPKATVQATLGSIAYQQKLLPGDEGAKQGLFIAEATAFTILVCSPLGAILTKTVGSKLAQQLALLDSQNGCGSKDVSKVSEVSPVVEKAQAMIKSAKDAQNGPKAVTVEFSTTTDSTDLEMKRFDAEGPLMPGLCTGMFTNCFEESSRLCPNCSILGLLKQIQKDLDTVKDENKSIKKKLFNLGGTWSPSPDEVAPGGVQDVKVQLTVPTTSIRASESPQPPREDEVPAHTPTPAPPPEEE